ncbi:ABC transporter substrate-binding protein [Balneatrix alpica]|uniref:ABC transporter substrate-binding protein n=1 Tax=Balneatrix alpica TaxID=75684 RepID=UPI002738842B|nr:ABC transporter substrate-binding protein [Balneatrix alpica]
MPASKRPAGCLASLLLLLPLLASASSVAPARVVSIHQCSDRLALQLASPSQLQALSYLSADEAKARQLPTLHAGADEVAWLQPDLVLADSFSSPHTLSLLRQLNIPVHRLNWVSNFADIAPRLRALGQALGQHQAGQQQAQQLEERLQQLRPQGQQRQTLLISQGGWTPATDTLSGDLLQRLQLRDARGPGQHGWQRLTLEQIWRLQPQLIIVLEDDSPLPSLGAPYWQLASLSRGPWQLLRLPGTGLSCAEPSALHTLERLNLLLEKLPHG